MAFKTSFFTLYFCNSFEIFEKSRVLMPWREFVQVSMLSSATGSLALDENAKFSAFKSKQNICCVSDYDDSLVHRPELELRTWTNFLGEEQWGKVKRVKLDTCKYSLDLEAHNAHKKQHLALGTSTCKLWSCKAHDFSTLTDGTTHLDMTAEVQKLIECSQTLRIWDFSRANDSHF